MNSQTTDRVNGKEGMEVARGRKECLQQTQKQDDEFSNASHSLPQVKDMAKTDTSGYAIGGTLSQLQEDNSWRSVAYLSKAMNETERNYKIYD